MGLDLLDIAYRIEKSFGIRFDVRELLGDWTGEPPPLGPSIKVGDVYNLILEKRKALNLPEGAGQLELLALADVRLALSRVLNVPPETIRPEDRLSRLLPLDQRRRQWRRLRRQFKGLGPLRARRWGFCLSGRFVWPDRIPPEVRTVERLAKTHLARNRRHYVDKCQQADSDEDVWYTLRVIIADALAVDVKEVTREADLVRDLGAD